MEKGEDHRVLRSFAWLLLQPLALVGLAAVTALVITAVANYRRVRIRGRPILSVVRALQFDFSFTRARIYLLNFTATRQASARRLFDHGAVGTGTGGPTNAYAARRSAAFGRFKPRFAFVS